MMLYEIMANLHNFFAIPGAAVERLWVIEDGALVSSEFLKNGQFYLIRGSVFNDGLHQHPDTSGIDEEFEGIVIPLAVPADVLQLSDEIEAWQDKNGAAAASPYQSESFGGYSYSKKSGSESVTSWQDAFKSRLRPWRKI